MQNEVVVTKKGNRFWKVVGILLAIAGVCFIAVKVYNKFFRKPAPALECGEGEDLSALESGEDAVEATDAFEVDADSVIANAADMA